jgi:succinoglycan biosynthesis protein ExoM
MIQETEGLFSYSVVVVDNDSSKSAEALVKFWQQNGGMTIYYYDEPQQSISLARNKAVLSADGNYIAFIDDDEFPEKRWLLNLYTTLKTSKADGVLGPVKLHFEMQPPRWVLRSGLLERPTFTTGTVLKARDTRTGNVLFAKRVFEGEMCPFDPRFGRTGGEDGDFFKRKIDEGYVFVWCNEAPVYETVPPERYKKTYFLKRALLRGVSEARLPSFSKIGILRSLAACFLYTPALPILLLISEHMFMKYLVKGCDHFGKLLALCGIEVISERRF